MLLYSLCFPSVVRQVDVPSRVLFLISVFTLFGLFSPPAACQLRDASLSFLIDVTLSNRPIDGFMAKVAVRLTCHVSTSEINHPTSVSLAEKPVFDFQHKFPSPFHPVLFLFFKPCQHDPRDNRRMDSPLASRDASCLYFHQSAVIKP